MGRPVVAIIGLQNVGKSMLFNRIVGGRVAVVSDEPGVTRDRNVRPAEWLDRAFLLVDTGGWIPARAQGIDAQVLEQTKLAVEEADALLFVIDAEVGAGEAEIALARTIRRRKVPCVLVGNKSDRLKDGPAPGLEGLGLGEPALVSAAHGTGVGDLLDRLVRVLPDGEDTGEGAPGARVAVVGRPNVGKSSLVNRLAGTYRTVVDETPGTTRDSVDTRVEVDGRPCVLVDTAGLRRRARMSSRVEFYSHLRTVRSLEDCDVALVLMDATQGVTQQDLRIAGMAHESGRGAVLVFNKMDLIEERRAHRRRLESDLERQMAFNRYAPVHYVSAKEGWGTGALLPVAMDVEAERSKRIRTADLNRTLQEAVEAYAPPSGPRPSRIYYGTQVEGRPPTFVVFVSRPENIRRNYIRYLVNRIRKTYGFRGTPIRLHLRKRV